MRWLFCIVFLFAICFSGCDRQDEQSSAEGHITLLKDAEKLKDIGATIIRGLNKPDSVELLFYYNPRVYLIVPYPFQKARFWFRKSCYTYEENYGIDRKLTDSLARVVDALFVQKTVAAYSLRERINSAGDYHEGNMLDVCWYKGGKKIYWYTFYLEDVFTSRIQYTEDCYVIAYSRPFRFLIQSLYYAKAIASGEKEEYEEHLESLQRDSGNYPGLEILVPLK